MKIAAFALALVACVPPPGTSEFDPDGDLDRDAIPNAVDCDPNDANVGSGTIGHADDDLDGFGTIALVEACNAIVEDASDCDDGDATINPDAAEACGNDVDENCDGGATPCRWDGDQSARDADLSVGGSNYTDVFALGFAVRDRADAAGLAIGVGGERAQIVSIGRDDDGDRVAEAWTVDMTLGPPGPYHLAGLGNVDDADDEFGEVAIGAAGAASTTVWIVRGPIDAHVALLDERVTQLYGDDDSGFGASISPIGDADGDDLDDFAIGAPQAAGGGAAWIVHGAPALTGITAVAIDEVGDSVYGENLDEAFGEVVAGIGDVDGDGRDDLAVGSASTAEDVAFRIGLFDGDGSRISTWYVGYDAVNNDGPAHPVAIAALGDMTGDGRDDFVVGMRSDDENAGAISIIADPYPPNAAQGEVVVRDESWRNVYGPERSFGAAVVGLGDVEHDGQTDLAVGCPDENLGATDETGAVYVLTGSALAIGPYQDEADPIVDLGVYLARFESAEAPRYGATLAGAGDLDRDGWIDLAVGSDLGVDVFFGGEE